MGLDIVSYLMGKAAGGGGGGGATILSGTSEPSAGQGSNGQIYLQYVALIPSVRYAKLTITATRGGSSGLQFSLVQLLNPSDNVIPYPAGTTVTSNSPPYTSGESAQNLLSSVDTKYYTTTNPSSNSPIEIVFDFGDALNGISKWRWYTANDTPGRDPTSFAFAVSSDGINYVETDSQTITPTTDRKALAYTSDVMVITGGAIIPDYTIIAAYAKVNGAWQNLIGTDISDITT